MFKTANNRKEGVHDAEADFLALLENISDAIIVTNGDGLITHINQPAERLFAYDRKELIQKHVSVLIPSVDGVQQSHSSQSISRTTKGVTGGGIVIPIDVNSYQAKDDISLFLIIKKAKSNSEPSALSEADAVLLVAKQTLQKANEELASFSYSISHDLKAPIRAIHGFTSILLEEYYNTLDESGKKALETIRQNADRMDKLINDLLELSRVGTKKLDRQVLNMNELVNEAIAANDLKPGVSILVHPLEPSFADRGLIRKVWENLIANAIKYTSGNNNSKIEIGCNNLNAGVEYWIRDNGVGFDSQYKDKLFKLFSRLHSKKEFEGTGAGLAIARRIIEAHDGSIWAESEINKGATFHFSLPTPP